MAMRRSSRVAWGEVRVGVVILFAFAVFLWAAFNGTGMTFFSKSHELTAYFDDVGGLRQGSPVWLGGIEVGHVARIEFVEKRGGGKIRVDFEVKEGAWPLVSADSKAAIGTMGLMGDKYLSLSVAAPGTSPAVPGGTIDTRTEGNLTTAFSGAPDLMANLAETTDHLNVILDRMERGEGFLGRMTTDSPSSRELDSVLTASKRLLVDMTDSQRRLVSSIDRAAGSFDSLSRGVLHGGGTLSRLVWDSSLYTEMTGMARRANSIVERWDKGGGTIGRLAADSSMYIETRQLVNDMHTLIGDIMANPKKYFKFSVF